MTEPRRVETLPHPPDWTPEPPSPWSPRTTAVPRIILRHRRRARLSQHLDPGPHGIGALAPKLGMASSGARRREASQSAGARASRAVALPSRSDRAGASTARCNLRIPPLPRRRPCLLVPIPPTPPPRPAFSVPPPPGSTAQHESVGRRPRPSPICRPQLSSYAL